MAKRTLVSGLIAGGILVLLFLLSHFLINNGMDAKMWEIGEIIGYSSMVIALSLVFFGIRAYRDKTLGGKITFTKALLLGVSISSVASIIFGIYVYLLFTVISPGLSGKMIEVYREKIRKSGETQQVIQQQLAQFEVESIMWNNPLFQALFMVVTVMLIGILISIISAAILKRK